MNILGVTLCLVNNHRLHEALAISSGENKRITPEGGDISCLVFPNVFPCEELVDTYHSEL